MSADKSLGQSSMLLRCSLMVVLLGLGSMDHAQAQPERLSDWMIKQNPSIDYPLALMWLVPEEKKAQQELQKSLVQVLEATPSGQNLKAWLNEQIVTGRAVIPNIDPRWLQANPASDPMITVNQKILTVARPSTVSVLLMDGTICQPLHRAGLTASSYLAACSVRRASRAWIAQPDGRIFSYGIADWNAQAQVELAPGAWLWAPNTDVLPISPAFSDGMIRFLASLGVAPQAKIELQHSPIPTPTYLLRESLLTASDWGEIGLLQSPTARMRAEGAMRAHISKVAPYTRTTIMFQPMPWLEAGFRYTDISNRQYDPTGTLQTNQSNKDKSLDFKLKLREESSFGPQIALGVRDVGGTGLFSSEYLVGNKRFGDFDVSLGLGWGYLGSAGTVKNPLSLINSQYSLRPDATTATGGEVGSKAFFKGPTSLFGGVQWRATENLVLKMERDGNHYQNEPHANAQLVRSPWNFGATYRYSPVTDMSIGLERGNKLMFGLTFHTELDGVSVPKLLVPPLPKFQTSSPLTGPLQDFAQLVQLHTGWDLLAHKEQSSSWQLIVGASGAASHVTDRLERLNALVQAHAPEAVRRWSVHFVERGIAMNAVEVDRAAWVESQTQMQPLSLKRAVVMAYAPQALDQQTTELTSPIASAQTISKIGDIELSVGPSYQHVIGGPDAFYLYRLGAEVSATYKMDASTWVTGTLDARLFDNFHNFKYTAPSDLPRVRTYQREYVTSNRVTMPLLQATHVRALSEDQFASVYGGYLESMYAGIGAEWLYRPWHSRVAFGVDVNHARQRDFNQNFSFRDYQVTTGHFTTYWDTGLAGLDVKLQIGQYLAGDRGATLTLGRRFDNGILLGAYATKTNVSAAQFGEGSFDKGIYLKVPFDVMMPKYSNKTAHLGWSPLTRDGGARLQRSQELYNITSGRDPNALSYGPAKKSTDNMRSEANFSMPQALRAEITSEPVIRGAAASISESATSLAQQLTHTDAASTWLWGAGWVLGASALDHKVDRWALNHSHLSGAAKLGNSVPLILGLGALADLSSDGVGWTALKSAGFTLAANEALRFSFGRARPFEERGSQQFDALRAQGLKSGFASNHVAIAFALATPFAQTYDLPWLYGFAGLTALGRVQSRQHWLSDTAAGGVLGYAIGSVMSDEHRQNVLTKKSGRQLLVSPQGIAAKWWWE